MIGNYFASGEVPAPMGTAYKALLPYQTFRTKTRDLALAVGSEKLWKIFCPVIGCPELADDPRYRTNGARDANRESLIATLQEVFLTRSYEEWEALLVASGIPVGTINTLAQVVGASAGEGARLAGRDGPSERGQGARSSACRCACRRRRVRCARPRRRWASTPTKCCATCSA